MRASIRLVALLVLGWSASSLFAQAPPTPYLPSPCRPTPRPPCESPYRSLWPPNASPTDPNWFPPHTLPTFPSTPGTTPGTPPGTPSTPGTPPTTPTPTDPSATPTPGQPETPQQPAPSPTDFAQATERGTEGSSSYSPNMFGDTFGRTSIGSLIPYFRPGRFSGQGGGPGSITVIFPSAQEVGTPFSPTPLPTPTPPPSPNPLPPTTPPGLPTPTPLPPPAPNPTPGNPPSPPSPTPPPSAIVSPVPIAVSDFVFSGSNLRVTGPGAPPVTVSLGQPLTFSQPAPPGTVTPLPGPVTVQVTNEVQDILEGLAAPGQAIFLGVEQLNQLQGAGISLEELQIGDATGVARPVNSADLEYTVPVDSVVSQVLFLNLANPASGGNVGRTKMSEDNNPLPRDRFIFNYDFFENVPLARTTDVNRLAFGVEKTLFSHRNSIELRIPFATTLSSDFVADGITNTSHAELGNIRIVLKQLFYESQNINIAAGLGFSLPSANDARVRLRDGTDLVRIHNETVVLSPYVAALWTPNDRFFNQTWTAIDFDTGGNRVEANVDGSRLREIGRLYEQPFFQLDTQFGYWLARSENPNDLLQGVAPFLELHYNAALGNAEFIKAGNFLVGDTRSSLHEFNLTAGTVFQLGNDFTLSVGAVVPLANDRFFDYQIGIRGNWYFGNRRRIGAPPSF